jgi:hypothetical protein
LRIDPLEGLGAGDPYELKPDEEAREDEEAEKADAYTAKPDRRCDPETGQGENEEERGKACGRNEPWPVFLDGERQTGTPDKAGQMCLCRQGGVDLCWGRGFSGSRHLAFPEQGTSPDSDNA